MLPHSCQSYRPPFQKCKLSNLLNSTSGKLLHSQEIYSHCLLQHTVQLSTVLRQNHTIILTRSFAQQLQLLRHLQHIVQSNIAHQPKLTIIRMHSIALLQPLQLFLSQPSPMPSQCTAPRLSNSTL